MKIEISIEKNGKGKADDMEKPELEDEQKVALGKKLQKNIALTRMERRLLASYLLEEEDD
jgi:hypothetical protein